jgi:branched-chain amino acid aminotransferase
MAPSAITPPDNVQQTAELSASAVAQKIAQTAPELINGSNGVESSLRSLDASKLTFTKTKTPMTVPQPGDPIIATSSQCTDHMITAKWTSTTGVSIPFLCLESFRFLDFAVLGFPSCVSSSSVPNLRIKTHTNLL